jgi:hypothetical protein
MMWMIIAFAIAAVLFGLCIFWLCMVGRFAAFAFRFTCKTFRGLFGFIIDAGN